MKRRLFTPSGTFVGWEKMHHGLLAGIQTIIRKVFGVIPPVPWIPFSAREAIEKILRSDSLVWEIGAGMSTLWLSSRVAKVTSIEASQEWFNQLNKKILSEKIQNIDLRFEWESHRMSCFDEIENQSLDLLYIDGGPRTDCLVNGFKKVKCGGFIYLDNWENVEFWRGAAKFLDQSKEEIVYIKKFIDYVPSQVGVYESLLIKKQITKGGSY